MPSVRYAHHLRQLPAMPLGAALPPCEVDLPVVPVAVSNRIRPQGDEPGRGGRSSDGAVSIPTGLIAMTGS